VNSPPPPVALLSAATLPDRMYVEFPAETYWYQK
jgi:hypothetical protein